jgi:hypothetical protein
MKTKNISFSLLLMGCLAFPIMTSASEMKERKETFSCERIIKPETQIFFENKVGELKVETWDRNSVKVDVAVSIDGDEDQVQKAMEVIRKMNFVQDGEKVTFNTRFYQMMNGMIPGRFTVVFLDGSKARLSRMEISFVLTMPKGNPLQLVQAYEKATLPDLDGKINIYLYESSMIAGRLPNCQDLNIEYGKAEIDSVQDISIRLYETKFILRHAGNVSLNSKYSETEIYNCGSLIIDSYEDKIHVNKHADLTVKAKYTTFTLADFIRGTFDLYESKLIAGRGDIVAISGKYCNLEFIYCKAVVFSSSYENKFICDQAGDFKATSSYSSYKITQLDGSLIMTNSYEDKISVFRVGKKFTGISLLCKYTGVDLMFEPGTAYKLDTDLKYSSFDFSKSSFREIRYHKEDDIFQYLGVTLGSDENSVPLVKVQMYEGGIKLK